MYALCSKAIHFHLFAISISVINNVFQSFILTVVYNTKIGNDEYSQSNYIPTLEECHPDHIMDSWEKILDLLKLLRNILILCIYLYYFWSPIK